MYIAHRTKRNPADPDAQTAQHGRHLKRDVEGCWLPNGHILEATAHCIIFVRVVVLWMMPNEIGEKKVVVANACLE
jgi:hypothetical protein